MNIAVWVVTGFLGAVFLLTGTIKLAELMENPNQEWAKGFPIWLKFIGLCEVAGAIGLLLPGILGIATWLVPAAAIGLALLMVGAALTHLRYKEYRAIGVNILLLVLAVFVAVERLNSYRF